MLKRPRVSIQRNLVVEHPALAGYGRVNVFGLVPHHAPILKEEISAKGFATGLNMAGIRHARVGIKPLHITGGPRRRKGADGLLHIHREGSFSELAAGLRLLHPPTETSYVVVVAPTAVHPEVRITIRQVKVADDELRVEGGVWVDVTIAVPLLSWAEENMKSILLFRCAAHGNQVPRPKALDI